MNIQLDNVLADITGVSGLRILRAVVAGERNLDVLASYPDPSCKNSAEVIRRSLEISEVSSQEVNSQKIHRFSTVCR
jgi:hypothetical protein